MTSRTYKIKDGMMYVSYPIEDYSSLLRYDWNLTYLANDIRRANKDVVLNKFLLKAKEFFAEEVENAKARKNSPLGNHSIFYHMYGHMNDWVRYAEMQLIQAKALLTQAYRIDETLNIIKKSRDIKDATDKLMDVLGLDEIGARYVVDQKLSVLTGIVSESQKEYVEELEKRLSNIRDLAEYDK